MPTDEQAVALVLRDLLQSVQRTRPAPSGLVPLAVSEAQVLRGVAADPGVTVTALADALGMRQSNTSTTVRSLVARGLVRRQTDADDRRVAHLHVTARARRHLGGLEEAETAGLVQALEALPARDRRRVVAATDALRRLDEGLRTARVGTGDGRETSRSPGSSR